MDDTLHANTESALTGLRLVDVDTHLTERHDLWTSRAPATLRDKVPQIKQVNGVRGWFINGDIHMGNPSAYSMVRLDRSTALGMSFWDMEVKDVHPACYDAKARVALMDEMGIWAQIVYPNVMGFGGQKANATIPDPIRRAAIEIYNDAMAELQRESGERLFPMALLPWWDIKASVTEARRCRSMGLRGVNTNAEPHLVGLPELSDKHWDPLWEAVAGMGMPVNFHIGASDDSGAFHNTTGWPGQNVDKKLSLSGTMHCFNNGRILANIFYSGMLDRHPNLKLVSVESGIGWVPFLLEMLDYQVGQGRSEYYTDMKLLPSEYFRRQVYACFWFERRNSPYMIQAVGVDNVMMETDFPHPTSLFPSPREYIAKSLGSMKRDDIEKVVGGNAARVYNLPINA
jgi:predicted TIM-barrel fold metal-dependent hydrolase